MADFHSGKNIPARSANKSLKNALGRLGSDPLMQRAQREIAFEKYLNPAIKACEGSGFVLPLSMAVIYDSINHGSWDKIRDRVPAGLGEKQWIKSYVYKRDEWLESSAKLRTTSYRTDFFLAQIARGNWNLNFPMNVHGLRLTEDMIGLSDTDSTAAPAVSPATGQDVQPEPGTDPSNEQTPASEAATDDPQEASPAVGQPSTEQTQNAENITNIQTGDKTVPDNFVAEDKTIEAPAKDGSTAKTAAVTVLGFAVPAGIAGFVTALKDAIHDGTIDAKEVFGVVLDFVRANQKYVFVGLGLLIGGMMLKKLYKQVTLWFQMYILARPDWHNVTVKPKE